MYYCGLDLGKKSSHFCIVDKKRQLIDQGEVRNRIGELTKFFGEIPPMKIVVEASTKTFWIADRLEEMGHEVIVVDPGRTKAIGAARIKHDKLDAKGTFPATNQSMMRMLITRNSTVLGAKKILPTNSSNGIWRRETTTVVSAAETTP